MEVLQHGMVWRSETQIDAGSAHSWAGAVRKFLVDIHKDCGCLVSFLEIQCGENGRIQPVDFWSCIILLPPGVLVEVIVK